MAPADTVVVRQIIDGIREGITDMTPAAKHVFELAIKQVTIEAQIMLWACFIMSVASVIAFLIGAPKERNYDWEEVPTMTGFILGSISLLMWLILGSAGIMAYVNPEWAALEKLRGLLS